MKKQQRILMLLENNPYPNDSRVRHEAQTLLKLGYSITVISPAKKGQKWREVVNGVTAYRYPAPPEISGFLGYVIEYGYSLIAMSILSIWVSLREGFSIIHAHNPPDLMVLIAIFYKLFGKKFVFDHHDLAPEMYATRGGSSTVHKVLLFFERLSCNIANHIIVTNESYKRLDIERNNVSESKITIVRNGPNPAMLELTKPNQTLRERAPHILGYLGEIGENDGVDHLIRALDNLRDMRQDWYCIIIGDGPAKAGAERLMKERNLDAFVEFAGWKNRDEFLPLLAAVDIGVEPIPKNEYTNRSTMIKIMEYMAMSKPIVAFDLTEHRASAADAAIYATPNDEKEFARSIAEIMDDPDRRATMGQIGRERVESRFAWTHQEKSLEEAYRQITDSK